MSITRRLISGVRAHFGVVAVVVVAAGGTTGGLVVSNIAKASPPTPTITSGPSGTVRSSSATFTYSDKQSDVTFRCSLDDAAYVACPATGQTYSGLTDGPRTFSVIAAPTAGGTASSPATRTWTVDLTGPTVTPTFPTNGGSFNAAAWSANCKAGICGTALDSAGIAGVTVSLRQIATNKYWNGTGFDNSGPTPLAAKGTSSWALGVPLPTDGGYEATIHAADSVGNSSDVVVGFTVDTRPPTSPRIDTRPDNPTSATTASFTFSNTESDVASYSCQLDRSASQSCSSPWSYSGLAVADHTFQVSAIDAAGNASPAASYSWTVANGAGFAIDGSLASQLYPGHSERVSLTLHNPNNFVIQVQAVSVSIADSPGCPSADNFTVTPLYGPVPVPANGDLAMAGSSYETNEPVIYMKDLATNQDACKGASLQLSFAGTATK